MQTLRHLALIVLLAGITFFVNLGRPKLWDRDEPRNAQCAVEMLERSDWTVPTFNGELRTHKPILLYWLMMISYEIFGVNEFSARFWSAFFGVATAVATYWIGRNLTNPRASLMASFVLVTTLMFNVSSRAATPDATLIFCCTLSFAIFIDGVARCQNSMPTRIHWLGLYSVMAAGVLAKGPVGFVLPCTAIGGFLMTRKWNHARKARHAAESFTSVSSSHHVVDIEGHPAFTHVAIRIQSTLRASLAWVVQFLPALKQMQPGLAVLAICLLALPWYIAVGIKTNGEWLEGFLWKHNLQRATSAMEGHNGSFLFYYPAAILVGFFPWSVFAVPVVINVWRRLRNLAENPNLLILLFWIGTFVVVFSLAQTKLPSYVTPTYPALAILVAMFFDDSRHRFERHTRRWMYAALSILSFIGATICIAGWISAERLLPDGKWICMVGLIPLTAGIVGILSMQNLGTVAMQRAVQAFSFAFIVAVFGWCAGQVSRHQEFGELFSSAEISPQTARLGSFASQEPSWVFYWGDRITHFRQPESSQAIEFLKRASENFVLTTENDLARLQAQATGQLVVVSKANYFLKKSKILLVNYAPEIARRTGDFHPGRRTTK